MEKIIDKSGLWSQVCDNLIEATAKETYWFGEFNSLKEFHQKENVNVIVERKANQLPVLHRETINKLNEILDSRIPDEQKKEIRNLINTIRNKVVLGEYKPSENNIYLYINTIIELTSKNQDNQYNQGFQNLLVTTYIHEMLHAYFDRTGHKGLPYIFEIEESLAEAGMLVFLDQVNDPRLKWALQNVRHKWPELKDYARGAELYSNWKAGQNDLIPIITNYKSKISATIIPSTTIPLTTIYVNKSRRDRDAFEDYLLTIGYSRSTAVERACVHPLSRLITDAVKRVTRGRTDDLFDVFSNSELDSIKSCVLNQYIRNPKRYMQTLELYKSHLQNSGLLCP